MSRFRFVDDHRHLYEVKRLCELAEVSRSGFYAWKTRPPSSRQVANDELLVEIRDIHETSRGTYGRPRVCGQLRRRGHQVNHKRVAALMREAGISGVSNRRKWRSTGPNRVPAPAPDLLERDFSASRPNERWVADITEFNTGEGRLYLAAVLDLYARRVVGWAIDSTRTAELVVDALVMAISRRDPDEVVHHADRGSQYTSMRFVDTAYDAGVALSFGTTGDCFDNAAMEAFWSTLKRELAHIHDRTRWTSRHELRLALFDYIEVFYNRRRHQAGLDHHTPDEHEKLVGAA